METAGGGGGGNFFLVPLPITNQKIQEIPLTPLNPLKRGVRLEGYLNDVLSLDP